MRTFFILLFSMFTLSLSAQAQASNDNTMKNGVVQTRSGGSTLVKPSFPTGRDGLMKFIDDNLVYPASAKKEGIEGTLTVQLSIDQDGKILAAKVVEPLGYGCDEAALEMVAKMPNWKPAMRRGKPTSILYNLPIQFRLR